MSRVAEATTQIGTGGQMYGGQTSRGGTTVRLKDRVAIVTGGASGIGRGIAVALAAAGARVAVLDLNVDGAQETADSIRAAGGDASGIRADVTARAEIDAAVAEVGRRYGGVHILVNNAGWDRPIPFIETDEAFWDRILAVNLKAHFHMVQAVLPGMIAQGGGRIVAIASDAGRVGSTGEVVYSAAKGGVIAFTKALAREMARHRVNVNCVCPGPSDTPLFQTEFAAARPKLGEALRKAIPWGRLGTPEDVAGAVVFLASDDAAFITGQTLSVSGGLTMI